MVFMPNAFEFQKKVKLYIIYIYLFLKKKIPKCFLHTHRQRMNENDNSHTEQTLQTSPLVKLRDDAIASIMSSVNTFDSSNWFTQDHFFIQYFGAFSVCTSHNE